MNQTPSKVAKVDAHQIPQKVLIHNSTGQPLFLSESLYCSGQGIRDIYFENIRVFKAGDCLNTLAWNNGIGTQPISLALCINRVAD